MLSNDCTTPPRLLRIRIAVADNVEVRADVAVEADRPHDAVDQFVSIGLRLRFQVEIGHPDELLDIGPTDQRAAHKGDLLVEIWLKRQPGQQRLQDRLRIDVYPRGSLVAFGNSINDRDADDNREPRHAQANPAAVPHAAQVIQ